MNKGYLKFTLGIALSLIFSCSTKDDIYTDQDISALNNIHHINGKLSFPDEKALSDFIKNQNNEQFEAKIRDLQKKRFNPLLPIFEKGDIKSKKDFLGKKLNRINKDLKFSGINHQIKSGDLDNEDIEDNLIQDDKFASVLNENRSIYVGNYVYIYTPEGVFKASRNYESELNRLLDYYYENGVVRPESKNPDKLPVLPICDMRANEDGVSLDLFNSPKTTTTQLTKNIQLIRVDTCNSTGGNGNESDDSGTGNNSGSGSSSPKTYPIDIKQDLGTCVVKDESLWQQIFGAAETCNDYYSSGRRVKTKFWNQNYLIYSSIGVSVKHQVKSWGVWSKSDSTDFIELGINYASWTYEYDAQYLDAIYNNYANNTLIKYKGKTYNTDGTVLTDIPVSVPNWPFNGDDPLIDNLEIYIRGNNILGSVNKGKTANRLLRDAAKDFIKKFGTSLEGPAEQDNIEVSGAVIDPLNRKLTFSIVGRIERDYRDCCATYYLDQNFLVGAKFNITHKNGSCSGNGCTSEGYDANGFKVDVFNAKDYENLTLDFYGLARRDGIYKGKRVITDNVKSD